MTVVHVLTNPMTTQNVRGFLTPLLVNRRRITDLGVKLRVFSNVAPGLSSCDVLMINAKYYGQLWTDAPERVVEEIAGFKASVGTVLYCDNYDSTAPIRVEVLPYVTYYLKNMLLRDRSLYARRFYGGRIFTDFYHRMDGVQDSRPQHATPVTEPAALAKLRLSWNYGLAHYGLAGSRLAALFPRLPVGALLRLPVVFTPPSANRPQDMSFRTSLNYGRESVAWHRQAMWKILGHRVPKGRLGRIQFFRELTTSKIVVSPFGWGEFSLRDFETFICGALLFKPNMDHLETYPNFYRDGETMISHRWDFADLEERLDEILSDYGRYVHVARAGQDLYRHYVASTAAKEEFAARFDTIIKESLAGDGRVTQDGQLETPQERALQ